MGAELPNEQFHASSPPRSPACVPSVIYACDICVASHGNRDAKQSDGDGLKGLRKLFLLKTN